MWLVAVLKELWPLLSVIASGGIIPFCIWWGRRLTERDKKRDQHEERRTKAAEDIPQALRDLKGELAQSVKDEANATRNALHAAKEDILEAIRSRELEELRELVRDRLSETPVPSSPPKGVLALKAHRP